MNIPESVTAVWMTVTAIFHVSGMAEAESSYSPACIEVTTIIVEPYLRKVSVTPTTNGTAHRLYEGYIIDVMDQVTSLLGITYRIRPVADGQYGFRDSDGVWNGMIGELLRGEVDVAAAPMFVTDQRREVVDFTEAFQEIQATVLMRREKFRKKPRFRSIQDLMDQSEYTIGTMRSGMIAREFRYSNDTFHRKVWRRFQKTRQWSLTDSNEEGIQRAREGRFAFILPSNIGEYVVRSEPCDLVAVDRFLLDAKFAFALYQGSGLVHQFNRALLLLRDNGFLDHVYRKWWIKKSACNGIQYSKMYSEESSGSGCNVTNQWVFLWLFALILNVHRW